MLKRKTRRPALVLTASVCFLLGNGFALADNIYVSNFTNNTIEVFNSSGQGIRFASTGLAGPAGLAFSGGNLYVANFTNNTIEKFDSSGHGTLFANVGLAEPAGLAFDPSGRFLYVANYSNSTIEVFNSAGHGSVFASTGLSGPLSLAFDPGGNFLYVANAKNSTIERFNSSGIGTTFATIASGVNVPGGLAFDSSGNLYVSNTGVDSPDPDSIVRFTPSGVGTSFASGLSQPAGLAFDSSGNLYEADYGTSTVKKFGANGSGSVFASSGLFGPVFVAVQVPEPVSWTLVALGGIGFLGACRVRHRRL